MMNDFTKEELIEIAEYCNWEPDNTAYSDFRRNLRIKIQSMIDKYCEHEWRHCEGDKLYCIACKGYVGVV